MKEFVAWIFILPVLGGTGIVVFTKNVVHAAYALALVLISMAAVYVSVNAEFLAIVQILLYAGGVTILLVFGIMMTNRLKGGKPEIKEKRRLLPALLSLILFASICAIVSGHSFEWNEPVERVDQVRTIGIAFLSDHIVAFELIAFLLLVALVGAAYLAKMSTND